MDIGVLTVPLGGESIDDAVAYLDDIGVDAVELGVGGWPSEDHVDREAILDDDAAQAELRELLDEHGLRISALATHNNPPHPDEERAAAADRELREAIELADQLDVGTVTCFSRPSCRRAGRLDAELDHGAVAERTRRRPRVSMGRGRDPVLDGSGETRRPPRGGCRHRDAPEHARVRADRHARAPGGRTNERIGANFDPSHLYWQGIDVIEAIRFLGDHDAIHHFHAKDTKVYDANARVKGVLDTTSYTDESDRSWLFRSIGYGHDESHWKDVVSTLRMVGYEGALSIEHEDSLTSSREGLEKAVDVLDRAVFETQPGDAYWAE